VPKCEECGSQNMLIKVSEDKYLCFEHFERSRVGDSEIEALIREYFETNLEYVDIVYLKKIRKLQGKKRKWQRI